MSTRLTISAAGDSFDLAVYPGTEQAALAAAVASRAGCAADDFFLTASASRYGPVVPLSAALPDGIALTLHMRELSCAPPSPPPSPAAAGSAADQPSAAVAPADFDAAHHLAAPLLAVTPSINAPPVGAPPAQRSGSRSNTSPSLFRSSSRREGGVEESITAMERMNRMTTDLANERTFLACARRPLGTKTAATCTEGGAPF